jgi:hypothetical protein
LESVVLHDGKRFEGFIKSESPTSIEFLEVHRTPGKPMSYLVRSIDRKLIAQADRLPDAEHEALWTRLEQHKHRTAIEARRMEDLALASKRREGDTVWQYAGTGFSLQSTASEAMTRRAIVRLEQIFAAYRQVLPPRGTSGGRLTIRIFGDVQQYHQALAELGLAIRNPAVYLQDTNTILAGSNLNQFDAQLAEVQIHHQKIRDEFDALVAAAPGKIKQLREQLTASDVPAAERQRIVAAQQKKWEEQRTAARRKIVAIDRRNADKFNEVAGQMFRRLAHEAFHAYLETFVYPRATHDVPRWLNEGLAQTFEAGLLEAGSLRIDAPNLVALERLQSDLRGGDPLPLATLLEARSDTFLSGHADDGRSVSRLYYYSWGLAYYLAFEQGVLGSTEFEAYLNPSSSATPVERFEKLVGMPLTQFEPRWRNAMLNLNVSR